ncbi:lipocalin family protein [Agaribacter flavus]|uniref:Outer membrane lipoprotein Blc n=1 Tax=Agaribacter flavus TaxID=1902781 RepID=A0ABV7FQ91_9ALTE
MKFFLLFTGLLLVSCTQIPDGIEPVSNFDKTRYLGRWYEIARLDHPFERGLSKITATYTLNNDGSIKVVNTGYNEEENKWDVAEGKAYFVSDEDVGHLKVSFFGPFYASYVIADLDKDNYDWAIVTGPSREYLWILSRRPILDEFSLNQSIEFAKSKGFPVEDLIFVKN